MTVEQPRVMPAAGRLVMTLERSRVVPAAGRLVMTLERSRVVPAAGRLVMNVERSAWSRPAAGTTEWWKICLEPASGRHYRMVEDLPGAGQRPALPNGGRSAWSRPAAGNTERWKICLEPASGRHYRMGEDLPEAGQRPALPNAGIGRRYRIGGDVCRGIIRAAFAPAAAPSPTGRLRAASAARRSARRHGPPARANRPPRPPAGPAAAAA